MELWEILGIAILAGPLFLTLISLTIVFIKTGYEDYFASKRTKLIPSELDELKLYIEELKAFKDNLETNDS